MPAIARIISNPGGVGVATAGEGLGAGGVMSGEGVGEGTGHQTCPCSAQQGASKNYRQ